MKSDYEKMDHKKDQPVAFKAQNIPPVSAANETFALRKLLHLCDDNLHRYKESFQEDEARLKSEKLTYNERNCLLFRSSEKKVRNVE